MVGHTCDSVTGNIGNSSCNAGGGYTCDGVTGNIGNSSCNAAQGHTCDGVTGSIGNNSCDAAGGYACSDVSGRIGNRSCTGHHACIGIAGSIGDFYCNFAYACSIDLDWTVPSRFVDPNGGKIPYFPPDGNLPILQRQANLRSGNSTSWRVDFEFTVAGGCPAGLTQTWTIDSTVAATKDLRVLSVPPNASKCAFSYGFPAEGKYAVTLDVHDAANVLAWRVTKDVIVQDWLIVSIGDSVASGEGNPDVARSGFFNRQFGPQWENQQCHRSHLAGPAQAALALEKADKKTSVTFIQLACSGATINAGLIGPYEGIEPRAGQPLEPQLNQLRQLIGNREIDALLISVGANDINFSNILERCFRQPSCDSSIPGSAADVFERSIARLPGSYDRLAQRLTLLRPPVPLQSSRVYITEYFDPTRNDQKGYCDNILHDHPLGGFLIGQVSADEARWASENVLERLNAQVKFASVRWGWQYVGGIRDEFLTHGYCATTRWIVTYADSIRSQGDKDGTIHPNDAGQKWYGAKLTQSLTADFYPEGDISKPRLPATH